MRDLVRQLLHGMEGIHGTGSMHRDVKPENVLVGPNGTLKICNFGIATSAMPPYKEKCIESLWHRSPE
jgi:cell division cycle 2-like